MLEARIAPGLAILSSRPKTSFLISIFSNTASMMRSQSASASKSSVGFSSPIALSTCSPVIRPLAAVAS